MNSLAPSMPRQEALPAAPTAEQVFRDFVSFVFRLARSLLDSEEAAEEVASEVLLQVMRAPDAFQGESWLRRLTANAACKREKASSAKETRQPTESASPPTQG